MTFRAITATLKLRTPLHVGTGNSTETTDDLLRRDASGCPLIPGTALAGVLRSIATRLAPRLGDNPVLCHALTGKDPGKSPACQCLTCKLFGTINPKDQDRGPDESEEEWLERTGRAARLLIYDAVLDHIPDIQIRDGIGIDRVTGAAARRERVKFDLEVLPSGTEFKLRMELDPRLPDESALQLLAATLAEWKAGRGAVGGRVSRGLGAFDLENVQFVEQDLNQPATLMTFLRDGAPWDTERGDKTWLDKQTIKARSAITGWRGEDKMPVACSWALAEFTLAATGLFLTHDLVQAGRSGFDHAPLLAAYEKGARPVLPGSSLRGVLRSQAERIARTLTTLEAWGKPSNPAEQHRLFLTKCPACNPLTANTNHDLASCNSFIKTLNKKEQSDLERKGAEHKLCLACCLFGSPWNGSRLRVEDALLMEGTDPEYKVLDFVAIDRFTGGGRDSAKFDAAVLWKPRFSVCLFLENPEPWELGWLGLVLRDLHEGLITVGLGRSKGFGQCEIQDRKLTIGLLSDADFPLPASSNNDVNVAWERLRQTDSPASGVYKTMSYNQSNSADWLMLANAWVRAFNKKVAGYSRPAEFASKEDLSDSYFVERAGHWLPDLYPARTS
jgi:CRISPR-associated RAMP protein (TIGR02581 family)